MSEKDVVLVGHRRSVMLNTLQKGKRYDERTLEDGRKVEIHRSVMSNAEGSALVKLGKTQVLVGIKFDVATPFSDRPTEGVLMSNAELLPTASPSFETGPPDENSIELARVVDRAIRSAETVDLKSFYIEEGKVLALFMDIYVLDHTGNFIDAATIAATAALTDTKMPKIEGGKIVRGEYAGSLPLNNLPVSTTFGKIGDYWVTDPSREEELAMESRITIATTDKHVCAIQKGPGKLTQEELSALIDIAFKRGAEIRDLL